MLSARIAPLGVLALATVLALAGCAGADQPQARAAAVLMAKALNAQSAGNPTLANVYFARVLEHDPDNKLVYYNLALLAEAQGNDAVAMSNFRIALRIDPTFALARSSLLKLEAAHPEPEPGT